jgi:hypothetical protein
MAATEQQPDVAIGDWVYCKSHVSAHSTGWCSVGVDQKIALRAQTREEAFEEVKKLGLPIYGHCDVCYKFIANEHRYRLTCPEHGLPR